MLEFEYQLSEVWPSSTYLRIAPMFVIYDLKGHWSQCSEYYVERLFLRFRLIVRTHNGNLRLLRDAAEESENSRDVANKI